MNGVCFVSLLFHASHSSQFFFLHLIIFCAIVRDYSVKAVLKLIFQASMLILEPFKAIHGDKTSSIEFLS